MGTINVLEKTKIDFYMEFMEKQLIEEFGNTSELVEMFNISKEIETIVKRVKDTLILYHNKEDRDNKSSLETLKEMISMVENDVLKVSTLYDKASEICEKNEKIVSKITLEKGDRYGNLFKILVSELKLKISDENAEYIRGLYHYASKYSKKNDDSQTESSDSIQMTLGKTETNPKAE